MDNRIVFGTGLSSIKDVEAHDVDPATFKAGLVASMASTGLPSLSASAGMKLGVSLGKSLSDTKKTDFLRAGLKVPVQAHLKRSRCSATITAYDDLLSGGADTITIGVTTFTAQAGAATQGDATFQAATSNAATATSLAAQINAHATAGSLVYAFASAAVVHIYAKVEGQGTGHDVAVIYNNLHGEQGLTLAGLSDGKLAGGSNAIADIDYAVVGSKVYVNNTTGKADVAMTGFSTITDAIYVKAPLTGINEDSSESAAALIDMQGGL